MTKTAARCPDLETIAAYLDGRPAIASGRG